MSNATKPRTRRQVEPVKLKAVRLAARRPGGPYLVTTGDDGLWHLNRANGSEAAALPNLWPILGDTVVMALTAVTAAGPVASAYAVTPVKGCEPGMRCYRLTKAAGAGDDGESYHVHAGPGGSGCDCPDHAMNRAYAAPVARECKHLVGLRAVGLLPE